MPQPNDDRNPQAEVVARILDNYATLWRNYPATRFLIQKDFTTALRSASKGGDELTLEVLKLVEERSDLRDQIISLLKEKKIREDAEGTIPASIPCAKDRDPREKAVELFRQFLIEEYPPDAEEIREFVKGFVDLIIQASTAAARRTK